MFNVAKREREIQMNRINKINLKNKPLFHKLYYFIIMIPLIYNNIPINDISLVSHLVLIVIIMKSNNSIYFIM